MKNTLIKFIVSVLLVTAAYSQPHPAKTQKIFSEYGNKRIDNYFWLSNPKDTAVIEHLKAENAFTEIALRHTEKLQSKIYDELISRIEQKYESLPVMENGFWYNIRYEEGKQYPLYCRRKENTTAAEEIFLDGNELAKGHQICLVRDYSVSPSNSVLAYGIDTSGDRRCDLLFKKLSGAGAIPECIPNTGGGYAWAKDSKTVFYTVNDHTIRSFKVLRHILGTDPRNDTEVYTERDSTFQVNVATTKDNKYILIISGSTSSDEVRWIPADNPTAPAVVVQSRTKDLLYSIVGSEGNNFFIQTNLNAKNFRMVKASAAASQSSNWQDVIAHRDDALLESVLVFRNYFVAQQQINGLPQILVVDRTTDKREYINFNEEAYVVSPYPATDAYDLDSIRYSYSSLTSPASEYYYSLKEKKKHRIRQEKVGGGYDASLYETRRLWAKAEDGKRVPVIIVYKKGLFKKDGSNPALLYAYGSYGNSTSPYFNRSVISLLDRGFIYAIAQIRGGQEMGRAWYEDGKILKKKNTFTDFIAAAELLISEKYTSTSGLFINGGSAGGMLMGAVVNMRPNLFKGVIADVPWMDVVTDMLNADLPLTTLEYDEWGNPTRKDEYQYMLSWSPYDNVAGAVYPSVLATGGLNDTQVPYFSPAKWVAKVRDHNKGTNQILFKCNMGAGHGGESGRFARQKLTALKYAFMLDLVGIKN